LQETADPFVLLENPRVYWADADLPAKKTNHQNSVYKPNNPLHIYRQRQVL
jgi:hypothetical protein